MLYDPNWGKLFHLDDLIDWLRTQPKNKTYNYEDGTDCLLAQYFRAKGYVAVDVSPWEIFMVRDGKTISRWLPNEWDRIAVGRQPGYEFGNRQWTYGKARKRAKALRKALAVAT